MPSYRESEDLPAFNRDQNGTGGILLWLFTHETGCAELLSIEPHARPFLSVARVNSYRNGSFYSNMSNMDNSVLMLVKSVPMLDSSVPKRQAAVCYIFC